MKFLLYSLEPQVLISIEVSTVESEGAPKSTVKIQHFSQQEITPKVADKLSEKLMELFGEYNEYLNVSSALVSSFSSKHFKEGLLRDEHSKTKSVSKYQFKIYQQILQHAIANCREETVYEELRQTITQQQSPTTLRVKDLFKVRIKEISKATFYTVKDSCATLGFNFPKTFSWSSLTESYPSATLNFERLDSIDAISCGHDCTLNMSEIIGEIPEGGCEFL